MLRPDKYTNLDFSVLNVGGMILKSLSTCSIQKYEDLENYVVSALGESARQVFVSALTFLYAVSRIEYLPASDSISLSSYYL